MKAIKFKLSGEYALFKKPYANNQPQSFVIPPKTAILGMIGAIIGWRKDKYIDKLPFENFKYGVKLLTPKIKKDLIGINLMQGAKKEAHPVTGERGGEFTFNKNPLTHPGKRGQRSPTRFEFLKDMEWEIFLFIEDKNIQDEFFKRLVNKKFVYNPYLGLQSLFAKIECNENDLINLEIANEINDNLYTSFDKNQIQFKITKPVAFYNELIPVCFKKDRSLPQTREMISFVGDYNIEISNKDDLKGKLYKDEQNRFYQFI
jgi:CRISPR-associated protein Cas5h